MKNVCFDLEPEDRKILQFNTTDNKPFLKRSHILGIEQVCCKEKPITDLKLYGQVAISGHLTGHISYVDI